MKLTAKYYSEKPKYVSVSNYNAIKEIVTSAIGWSPIKTSNTIGVWHVKYK